MPQVGIFNNQQQFYGVAPTFSRIGWVNGEPLRIGFLAGAGYVAGVGNVNSVYVGNLAGQNVTTGFVCAFGQEAASGCTSGVVDAFGDGAARLTTTGTCCAFGHGAAGNGILVAPGNVCAFGYHAGYESLAEGASFFGYEAGVAATTGRVSAFGFQAGHDVTTGEPCLFGAQAGSKITTAHASCFGTNAGSAAVTLPICAFGYYSLTSKTSGTGAAFGTQSAQNSVDGNMTGIGYMAGFSNTHGGVYLGFLAGAYETADEKLFIDNMDRGTEANGRVQSLIYGTFNANPVLQTLWVNGTFNVLLGAVGAYANNAAAAAGGVPIGGVYRTNADPSILCIRSA